MNMKLRYINPIEILRSRMCMVQCALFFGLMALPQTAMAQDDDSDDGEEEEDDDE